MSVKNSQKASQKKILLAEDDNSMRRFLAIILEKLNYEVLLAEDGLAAMKIALENDVDAVVADAIMPNLTGYDLRRILSQNPAKKQIPFIILSGFDQDASDTSKDCSADAYLTKSSDITEQLEKTLAQLLERES